MHHNDNIWRKGDLCRVLKKKKRKKFGHITWETLSFVLLHSCILIPLLIKWDITVFYSCHREAIFKLRMHLVRECAFKDGNEDTWAISHQSSYPAGGGRGDVCQTICGLLISRAQGTGKANLFRWTRSYNRVEWSVCVWVPSSIFHVSSRSTGVSSFLLLHGHLGDSW